MAKEIFDFRDGTETADTSFTAAAQSGTGNGYGGSQQFLAVKLTGATQVGLVAASTDAVYGIIQNKPTSGQAAEVAREGVSKACAGAAISAGAAVMANSSGQLITRTTGSGNTLVGYAVDAAAASGDLFTLALKIIPVLT